MSKLIILSLAALVIVLSAVMLTSTSPMNNETTNSGEQSPDCQLSELPQSAELTVAGRELDLFVANSPDERAQGLSDCRELPEDTGLLFVFDQPDRHSFWMKDMYLTIDIIWLARVDSETFSVVYIKDDARPESYPESFKSAKNARYVVEVDANFVERNQLKTGDEVQLDFSSVN